MVDQWDQVIKLLLRDVEEYAWLFHPVARFTNTVPRLVPAGTFGAVGEHCQELVLAAIVPRQVLSPPLPGACAQRLPFLDAASARSNRWIFSTERSESAHPK